MNLKNAPDLFDQRQIALVEEIIKDVKRHLEGSGLPGEKLKDVTGSISFSIAALLDNSASFESNGVEVIPYLTFQEGKDELVHCGGNYTCTNTCSVSWIKSLKKTTHNKLFEPTRCDSGAMFGNCAPRGSTAR